MAYYLLAHEGLFVGSSAAVNCVGAVKATIIVVNDLISYQYYSMAIISTTIISITNSIITTY